MNKIKYMTNNPALSAAESATEDFIMELAEDQGFKVTLRREPAAEPNSLALSVLFTPHLLERFEYVAWRRSYRWLARHHGLPADLVGTWFDYEDHHYEFAGASLRGQIPSLYFVARRTVDDVVLRMSLDFVKKIVVPALPRAPGLIGMLSLGFGEKEVFFQL